MSEQEAMERGQPHSGTPENFMHDTVQVTLDRGGLISLPLTMREVSGADASRPPLPSPNLPAHSARG